jgi:RNA polymerase sigma-70 factor (ECF subfamily)
MALLIEPVIPALRRYARALTRDRSEADDLVQDCLERAVGRWAQRRDDADTRTWMFAILHNLAVSRHRQARRCGPHLDVDQAEPSALAQAPTQEARVRHGELLRALDALPADQRGLLLLVGVEGCPTQRRRPSWAFRSAR